MFPWRSNSVPGTVLRRMAPLKPTSKSRASRMRSASSSGVCSGPMGSMQLPSTSPAPFAASMVFRRVSTLQRVNTPSPRRTTWYTPAMPMRTSSRA